MPLVVWVCLSALVALPLLWMIFTATRASEVIALALCGLPLLTFPVIVAAGGPLVLIAAGGALLAVGAIALLWRLVTPPAR